jgi:diguanylate cyclase (GGDEF)-like protein/putative nucleotidyltransferase with HDIG domain
MVSTPQLTRFARNYIWTVIAAGLAVLGASIYKLSTEPIGNEWFILAALTLISGSATVRLPASSASISISETFVFTAVLLYGPAAGTVIVALDGLVGSFWLSKRHRELHRALFNMSAPAVSAWISATLFFAVTKIAPLIKEPSPANAILPGLILFALTYFGLNSWLITFVIALEKQSNPMKVWRTSFAWLSLNYFGGASVAFLFVGYNRTINVGYIGAILPLLLVLYFTFKTAMGRVEDADKHVEQINRLYLSTIETLAMAIDAKDQVTHGHIRRVQSHATALAREVGVRDEKLLKAIEAAALLHDMGKLAVPEYILNKPGKLTESEFEKMKVHASVGADILSAIDFPYPVVPIVRHHHENWDGSGYPTGISGTAIPIGARILSVVDCFDALTSDRPYRLKLSDADALDIVKQRRGTMYDPMVVDTFFKVHALSSRDITRHGPPSDVLNTIAHSRRAVLTQTEAPNEIASRADEMLTVFDFTRALAGQVGLGETGDVIAQHLTKLIPSSTCVFYLYDAPSGELEAWHVTGEAATVIRGIRIPLGQRISGWVAANRKTICNSDAALDLGDKTRTPTILLKSCLSTALLIDDELVGVVSLYSGDPQGFKDSHQRIIEALAGQIALAVKSATDLDGISRRDVLTDLPDLRQLEQFVDTLGAGQSRQPATLELLFIGVVGLEQINSAHGSAVCNEALRHVIRHATAALRIGDLFFRYSAGEFVLLLNGTHSDAGTATADRVVDNIRANPLPLQGNGALHIDVCVTASSSPGDGDSLAALIKTAMSRISRQDEIQHSTSF